MNLGLSTETFTLVHVVLSLIGILAGLAVLFGLISLAALAVALLALYGRGLAGSWRAAYVVAAVLALYLNVFVGVVQAFRKLPALQALAPTQSEPPFLVAQLGVLILFVVLGFLALRRFHPAA